MGLFSRQPTPPPRDWRTAVIQRNQGTLGRVLSPTPDLQRVARRLIAAEGLTGMVHPDNVVYKIVDMCGMRARQGLERGLFSGVVYDLELVMARRDFTAEMFFDFLTMHGTTVGATYENLVEMLATPAFEDAMGVKIRNLAAQAQRVAEREILSGSAVDIHQIATEALGAAERETDTNAHGTCDARRWVDDGTGLSVCAAIEGHSGAHDWVPARD
jgi:hypothetical protein